MKVARVERLMNQRKIKAMSAIPTTNDKIDRWFFEISMTNIETDDRDGLYENHADQGMECCFLCGKLLKSRDYFVHYTIRNTIISSAQDIGDDSMGFFAVGSDCVRKIPNNFVFAKSWLGIK